MPASSEDDDVPSLARIYDRLLGGAQNFAADRDRADRVATTYPRAARWTWANRAFLRHAVERALAHGIDQFIDLGSGIPAADATHVVARSHDTQARVAYVDHEAVAVVRSRETLADVDDATITAADIRDPSAVLAAPGVARLLDLDRPIAILAMAVLHCVPDTDGVVGVLRGYRDALAPGSLLAMTHTSSDLPDHPELAQAHLEVLALYADADDPLYSRTRAEIVAMTQAAGFTVDADGLVEISRWSPLPDEPLGGYALVTDPLP